MNMDMLNRLPRHFPDVHSYIVPARVILIVEPFLAPVYAIQDVGYFLSMEIPKETYVSEGNDQDMTA
jgi:hypothetical protein